MFHCPIFLPLAKLGRKSLFLFILGVTVPVTGITGTLFPGDWNEELPSIPLTDDSTWFAPPPQIYSVATDQERRLLADYANRSLSQLQELAARETTSSPQFPFVQLSLGDRYIQEGDEAAARRHWEAAAAFTTPGVATEEAKRRLVPATDMPPFHVGVLLPLSGKFASLANNLLNAARKAVADYRDTPIVLVPMDSGNDPQQARAATEALVAQKVSAIVGPIFKEQARSVVEIAGQANIPLLPLNPNRELVTDNRGRSQVWLDAMDPVQQAQVMARYAHYQEKTSAAVLAPDTDYGHLTGTAFAQEFSRLGGQVTGQVYFPTEAKDVTPWVKSLRVNSSPGVPAQPPESLFLPTTVEQTQLILPQLSMISPNGGNEVVDLPLLLGTVLWNRNELMSANTALLIGAAFCDTSAYERLLFRQAYRKAWDEDPASLAQLAYDGVAILAQLLRDQRLGGARWEDAFARPEGFRGAMGHLYFGSEGIAQHHYQIYQVGPEGVLPLPEIPELNQVSASRYRGEARSPFDARSAYQPGYR